jgi:hypothetical protein
VKFCASSQEKIFSITQIQSFFFFLSFFFFVRIVTSWITFFLWHAMINFHAMKKN